MPKSKKARYVFYVDEAGDDGLKASAPGTVNSNSEWFVLGGIVTKTSNESDFIRTVNFAKDKAGMPFGRDIHFAKLNNHKKAIICRELALGNFRWFAVFSHKENMRKHKNERAELVSVKKNILYNWMLRILLERVTKYCKNHSFLCSLPYTPSDVHVILSDRGGLRTSEFGNYFSRLWIQFQSGNTYLKKSLIDFSVFNPTNISSAPNSELYGLQVADVIVSSLYKSLPQPRQPNPTQEYIEYLLPRGALLNSTIFDMGLVALPFEWESTLTGYNLQAIKDLRKLAASPRLCFPTTK